MIWRKNNKVTFLLIWIYFLYDSIYFNKMSLERCHIFCLPSTFWTSLQFLRKFFLYYWSFFPSSLGQKTEHFPSLLWSLKKEISACFRCSVATLCLTLCEPMDCSTPGFPVLHDLPELAQTHVPSVSDVI